MLPAPLRWVRGEENVDTMEGNAWCWCPKQDCRDLAKGAGPQSTAG